MVSSKEPLSSLDLSDGSSIHMGDDSQIPSVGKGSIQFDHGVLKNVLYVTSIETNMLSIYHMTHIGSSNQVIFEPYSVEILEISTGNLVVKGIANHAFKAYEFSHFLTHSYQISLLTHANETIRIWHERFNHLNFKYLQQLHNE